MAQQDTGLGWSAKEEYLIQNSNVVVGSIPIFGGPSYPGQPIPKNMTGAADIIANGFPMIHFESSYQSDPDTYTLYCAAAGDYDVLVYGVVTGSGTGIDGKPYERIVYSFLSKTQNARVTVVRLNHYNGNTDIDTYTLSMSYSSFYTAGRETNYANPTKYLPIFSSADEAIANVIISNENITKTRDGYAVSCLAKWKTANNVVFNTPVLISSVTANTDMTYNDSSHSIAKLNMLLHGVRFYMAFFDITSETPVTSTMPLVDLTERGEMSLDTVFMTIISTSYANITIINSPDPYEEEGAGSGEEGGDGEDLEDDEMGISHHAIPAAINTGFCRIYCPSEQQLRDLSNFLWSAQYDLTAVKKLFANPMDSVLGLSAVPLNLSGANAAVYLGGVDTEMAFPMVSYQSYQVPMGAITVEKRWGSYLDYDPYTKFSIFLPFIGFKDLSADDIMGKQIILDYDVDILSGACTARLQAGGNVLYQWSGQCSIQLPVTASNWNQVFQGATSAALSAGLAVATGSAGPVLAGALAAEGAQAIMGKPRIERGGTASGSAGWMGGLTPYLVRVTPEAVIPSDQNKFIGYPAFSSISLGALSGYNEISSIHLEGIPATGAELDELEAILKGGVIF